MSGRFLVENQEQGYLFASDDDFEVYVYGFKGRVDIDINMPESNIGGSFSVDAQLLFDFVERMKKEGF